jgi:Tol biopolymer transport system component
MLAISAWVSFRHGFLRLSSELRSVQLTASSGLDIGASPSPDGSSFVYSSNCSGQFEICKRAVDSGTGEVQLTRDGTQNIEPAWSPDGRWIAYHSVARHGIWLIPSAGGTPQRLTAFGSMPAWSPEGRQIVFSAAESALFACSVLAALNNPESGLWPRMAPNCVRSLLRTNPPGGACDAQLESYDKDLVFVAVLNESAIWNLELSSGKLDMLVQAGRDVPGAYTTRWNLLRDPRFGAAGKGLDFAAMNGQGSYAIYWLRRSGEQPKELYATRGDAPMAIGLSPDGKRLAFTRFLNTSQLWSIEPSTEPRPVFQGAVLRTYRPSFSPDGKLLAFVVETVGRNNDMWIMNADGTGALPVSSDPGPKEGGDTWNLEGTGLLYTYYAGSRIEFRRYDIVRKTNRVLYSWASQQGLTRPVLMPDEQEVVSSCSRPLNICLSPARGGPPGRSLSSDRARRIPMSPATGNGSLTKCTAIPRRSGSWTATAVTRRI